MGTIIELESCGRFITARLGNGVTISCKLSLTDCGESELLDAFVARHGGPDATADYLLGCYRDQ